MWHQRSTPGGTRSSRIICKTKANRPPGSARGRSTKLAKFSGAGRRATPTSHPMQINEVLHLIMTLNPRSLLDMGFSKFGFLAREYLELWNWREAYGDWQRREDGLKAHESYITPLQKQIYNQIHSGDVSQMLPSLTQRYDLILLIDVI